MNLIRVCGQGQGEKPAKSEEIWEKIARYFTRPSLSIGQ